MKKVAMVLMFALAAAVAPVRAGAQEETGFKYVRIKLNYWTANYNGEIKVVDTANVGGIKVDLGQSLDLADDLDIENPMGIPEVEAVVRLSRNNRIILSYFTVLYTGEKTLDSNTELNGVIFPAGSKLESEFDFSRLKVLHAYTPLNNEVGNLALMWGLEYYWLDVSYEGTENATGMRITDDFSQPLPIPVIGIGGELNLPWGFGLYGSITGMGINYQGMTASYTDIDAGLSWQYKFVYAAVGYRTIDTLLDAPDEDPEVNFHFKHDGVVATVGVQL